MTALAPDALSEPQLSLRRRSEPLAVTLVRQSEAAASMAQHVRMSLEGKLGRFACTLDHPCKARDLLAPIYTWFTEGFDTPDRKAAKALLESCVN